MFTDLNKKSKKLLYYILPLIFGFSVFYAVAGYAAWNTKVSDGQPLTAGLWNDWVTKLAQLTDEAAFRNRFDFSVAGSSGTIALACGNATYATQQFDVAPGAGVRGVIFSVIANGWNHGDMNISFEDMNNKFYGFVSTRHDEHDKDCGVSKDSAYVIIPVDSSGRFQCKRNGNASNIQAKLLGYIY